MKYDKIRGAQVIESWPARLPFDKLNKVLFAVSGFLLVASLLRLAMAYGTLPEGIPTHFNASGEVDAGGGKGSLLLIAVPDIVVWASLSLSLFFLRVINIPVALLKRSAEEIIRGTRVMINVTAIFMVGMF